VHWLRSCATYTDNCTQLGTSPLERLQSYDHAHLRDCAFIIAANALSTAA
jgi:hypothetical protein